MLDEVEKREKKLGVDVHNPFEISRQELKQRYPKGAAEIKAGTQWCLDRVKQYTIAPGNSWGKAPNEVVVAWGERCCDHCLNLYRLEKDGDDDIIPSE
jgi:hypothetical protein